MRIPSKKQKSARLSLTGHLQNVNISRVKTRRARVSFDSRTLFRKLIEIMASTEVQPRIPMYRVQPYFKIKKIKLPDCMYLLHPIHSPAYWKALVRSRQCVKMLEYKQISSTRRMAGKLV